MGSESREFNNFDDFQFKGSVTSSGSSFKKRQAVYPSSFYPLIPQGLCKVGNNFCTFLSRDS